MFGVQARQHTMGFCSFIVLCESNPENFDALVTGQVKKGYRYRLWTNNSTLFFAVNQVIPEMAKVLT